MRTIGPYRLGERLGVGAMGEVHVVASAQRLAIKTLVTDDPDTVRAFSRETRAVAQLHHRGVVTIVDHGLDDGPRYLVMERADRTLADAWPEDWDGVTDLVLQLLEGLAHVHARGLVHRDLKASNVLAFDTVSGGIRWALTDFGLAQRVGGRDGTTWGTPTSMAPEQFEGRWVDFGPPTDLYALGCLVWRAVCGAGPFTGRDAGDLAAAHLTRALPPLAPRMAVPVDLEAWLATLLRKAPEARFACAADASWAFRGLARPSGSPGSPRPLATGEPTQTAQEAWSTFPGPSASTEPPRARPAASVEEALRVLPPVPLPRGIPGTSLIATRELPTVARWEERRWLWRELLAVCRTHRARVRALMGRPGHGRRHLARWVARRAEELGTAVGIGAAADLITLAHALLRSTGVPSDALAAWVWAELERSHLAPEPQRVLARGLGVDRGTPPTSSSRVGGAPRSTPSPRARTR
ncbi:MAG: protein kinase [Myxococcota bacterium]